MISSSTSNSPESQRSTRSGTSGATSLVGQSGQERMVGDFTAQTGAYLKHVFKTVEHLKDHSVYLNLELHTKQCKPCAVQLITIRKVMEEHWENLFLRGHIKEEEKAQKRVIKSEETFNTRVRGDIKDLLQSIGAKDKNLLQHVSKYPLIAAGLTRLMQQSCNVRMNLLASLTHRSSHPIHPLLYTPNTNFIYLTPDEATLNIWHTRRKSSIDYDETGQYSARAIASERQSDYTDIQHDPMTKQMVAMHGFSESDECVLFEFQESVKFKAQTEFVACPLRLHPSIALGKLRMDWLLEDTDRMFETSNTFRPHLHFNQDGSYMLIRPNSRDAYCFTRDSEYGTFNPIGVINHRDEPLSHILFSPNNTFIISTSENMEVFWKHVHVQGYPSSLENSRCDLPTDIGPLEIAKIWCPTDTQCIAVLNNGQSFTQTFDNNTLKASLTTKVLPPLAAASDTPIMLLRKNHFVSLHTHSTPGMTIASSPAIKLNEFIPTSANIQNVRTKLFSNQEILHSSQSEKQNFFAVITQSQKKKKVGTNMYNLLIYSKNDFEKWGSGNIDLCPFTMEFQGSNGADFGAIKFSPNEEIFAIQKQKGQIDLHLRETNKKTGEHLWEKTAYIQVDDIKDFVFSHNSQMVAVIHSNETSISLFTHNNKGNEWLFLDETVIPEGATVDSVTFRQDDHQLAVAACNDKAHLYNLTYSLPRPQRTARGSQESSQSDIESDTESGHFSRGGARSSLKKAAARFAGSVADISKSIKKGRKKEAGRSQEKEASDTEQKTSTIETLKRGFSFAKLGRKGLKKEKIPADDSVAKSIEEGRKEEQAAAAISTEPVVTHLPEEATMAHEQQQPEEYTGYTSDSFDSYDNGSQDDLLATGKSQEQQTDTSQAQQYAAFEAVAEQHVEALKAERFERLKEGLQRGLIERGVISDTQTPAESDVAAPIPSEEQPAYYHSEEHVTEESSHTYTGEGAVAADYPPLLEGEPLYTEYGAREAEGEEYLEHYPQQSHTEEYATYADDRDTQYSEDPAALYHTEPCQDTTATKDVDVHVEPSSERISDTETMSEKVEESSSSIHAKDAETVETELKMIREEGEPATQPEETTAVETLAADVETEETLTETVTPQAEAAAITETVEQPDTQSEESEDNDNLLPSDIEFSSDVDESVSE